MALSVKADDLIAWPRAASDIENLNLKAMNMAYSLMTQSENEAPLKMTATQCCLCEHDQAETLGTGEDFEYRTSRDSFTAMQCRSCSLVYLNPRPTFEEFARIYPSNYHAFGFSESEFGFVFKARRRLEAKRLLGWCRNLPDQARIIDIGCGDGFHLELLKDFGKKTWQLEGVDADERAARMAHKRGLTVHHGLLENLALPQESYDLAILIQTIEHLAAPLQLLANVRKLLRPGGRVVIVTDNTDTLDFRIFKQRHWGGYHFPRHWNLFNPSTINCLAEKTGYEVEKLTTQISPVNWTYSVRNTLTERNAPLWLIEMFSLKSTLALGVFTIFDILHNLTGHGALLNAILKRPLQTETQ